MAACSTPMENSVFKRPLLQTLSSGQEASVYRYVATVI